MGVSFSGYLQQSIHSCCLQKPQGEMEQSSGKKEQKRSVISNTFTASCSNSSENKMEGWGVTLSQQAKHERMEECLIISWMEPRGKR